MSPREASEPGSGRTRPSIPHVPALDGLRGLAVAGILLFHAGHLRGGWLGVDLFFVLSGFLITSLLLVEFGASGDISLPAFWARRARRLLPALFGALLGVAAYAALLAQPEELTRIRMDGLATLLYVANWNAIFTQQDYWAIFAAPSPLDHAWSLAIEEQFYLVWPVVALILLRCFRGSPRALATSASLLAVASALWMMACFEPAEGTARVYFGTDTRASAVLIGAALAAWLRSREASPAHLRGVEIVGLLAASALAWAWWQLDGQSPLVYRGGLFATQLAAAALIAAAVQREGRWVPRGLSWSPLRGLGLVSYGLYLWHWPVYGVLDPVRMGFGGWPLTALRIAVSLAFAGASYFALERPIRRGTLRPARALALAAAGGATAAAALLLATRLPAAYTDLLELEAGAGARGASEGPGLNVLLLGDSVAKSFLPHFRSMEETREIRFLSKAIGACTTMPHDRMRFAGGRIMDGTFCDDGRATWYETSEAFEPNLVLLMEGWAGLGERWIGDRWLHPCDPSYDAIYATALEQAVTRIATELAPVVLATMPPVDPRQATDVVLGGHGVDREEFAPVAFERMECQNAVRRTVAAKTGADLLDLASHVCPRGRCPSGAAAMELRPDGLHFRGPRGLRVAAWIADELIHARPEGIPASNAATP